jgi:hypothetical protein
MRARSLFALASTATIRITTEAACDSDIMMQMTADIDVDRVIAIAERAGRAIMAIYEGDNWDVDHKADNSPLTRADREANQIICDALQEWTPHIPIISEENKLVPYNIRKVRPSMRTHQQPRCRAARARRQAGACAELSVLLGGGPAGRDQGVHQARAALHSEHCAPPGPVSSPRRGVHASCQYHALCREGPWRFCAVRALP